MICVGYVTVMTVCAVHGKIAVTLQRVGRGWISLAIDYLPNDELRRNVALVGIDA